MTTETENLDALRAVADALAKHCRDDTTADALATLYHPDAVSVEAVAAPGADTREAVGLDAIRGKHAWWEAAMEVHSASADGPYLHGDDRFGMIFEADITDRETGERSQMKEIGVYTVADGKIVREEFFYTC